MGSETRRRDRLIPVRVSDEERSAIRDTATAVSLAPSTLMRELALGHRPRSTIDAQAIHQLARLAGDLGRTGGLLKMWLSTAELVPLAEANEVTDILQRTLQLQDEIKDVVRRL